MRDVALALVIAAMFYVTWPQEIVLLTPEPRRFSIRRWRTMREQQETLEETNASTWFGIMREARGDSLDHLDPSTNPHPKIPDRVIHGTPQRRSGSHRRGSVMPVRPAGHRPQPPWEPVPPPGHPAPTMIYGPLYSIPPRAIPLTAPPEWPEPLPEPPAIPQPAEPHAWQPGDPDDPPTLVRGLRVIMDNDLGEYLRTLPGYPGD